MNTSQKKPYSGETASAHTRDLSKSGTSQDTPELLLDNQLCFPLYSASKEVVRSYTPLLKPFGLTYTQYITMMALWEHQSLDVSELGELLYLDSGTLTPLLKKLESKGYVVRRRADSDSRRLIVSLTNAGRHLKQQIKSVPHQIGSCVNLSPEETIELKCLLDKVLTHVLER